MSSAKDSEQPAEPFLNPEDEDSVTLVDVLEENEKAEEDANAVLGASDDQNCTYSSGYLKRQALYACITCLPKSENNDLAGLCLACSYHCHDGHELIELYTKRNFRCDCGNSKFPDNKCTLNPHKDLVNSKNQYNHNFKGLYCTCDKPYPDPEDTDPDEMIQCVICEDWFHSKHLGQKPPSDLDFSEVICDLCMNQHPILHSYVNMTNENEDQKGDCKIQNWAKSDDIKATFWPTGWRKNLCCCDKCKECYQTQNLEFLLDEQDTVDFYEEKGKASKCPTHNDRLMMALSSLNRVQQIEAIQEYQSFSSELKDYLKKFAENKKVVREEDIREFFGQLKERKRQRTSIPHFCH